MGLGNGEGRGIYNSEYDSHAMVHRLPVAACLRVGFERMTSEDITQAAWARLAVWQCTQKS